MRKARHKPWSYPLFRLFLRRLFRRHFAGMHWGEVPEVAQDKSILLLANHWSWWDGFMAFVANDELFRRKFHSMMLEEELEKRPLLQWWGAYSVRKGHRSIVETLQYTRSLLQKPENLVAIFPQGRIESCHTEKINFEKGVERVISHNMACQVVFCAVLPDYLDMPKPSLYFYFELYDGRNGLQHEDLEAAYNQFYTYCKIKQAQNWA